MSTYPSVTGMTKEQAALELANIIGGAGVSNAQGKQGTNPAGYGFSIGAGYWTPVSGSGEGLAWDPSSFSFVTATVANIPPAGYVAQLEAVINPPTPIPVPVTDAELETGIKKIEDKLGIPET